MEQVVRPTLEQVFGRFCQIVALRSTCTRLQVGSVITSADFTRVLSIGYNGNAKGLRNTCDRREPGNCGCIHSEINALLKLDYTEPHKIMFVTDSPCEACAKAMINAGISRVYYLRQYRRTEGVELLRSVDIPTELLTLPESLI
jgi:dCMP deaminase